METPMYCVAGLGNPGERYIRTRHNLGFRVADRLATERSTDIRRLEYQALTATVRIGRSEVLLMKPQTYMNLSGRSLSAACTDLDIPLEQVVAVYDDVDLPLGRVRVRRGGGSGGHRGVASIIEELGGAEFPRVRIGVGRPPEGTPVDAFVLAPVGADEDRVLEDAVVRAAEAVGAIVTDGVDAAMCRFNAITATGVDAD
jgi:PTH1 family peptidyl-tRNA hydrolase